MGIDAAGALRPHEPALHAHGPHFGVDCEVMTEAAAVSGLAPSSIERPCIQA
jgi:hypothetical protein